MLETLMVLLLVAITLFTILAITSVLKLHFDNYEYCKDETTVRCNLDDYNYCASFRK